MPDELLELAWGMHLQIFAQIFTQTPSFAKPNDVLPVVQSDKIMWRKIVKRFKQCTQISIILSSTITHNLNVKETPYLCQ